MIDPDELERQQTQEIQDRSEQILTLVESQEEEEDQFQRRRPSHQVPEGSQGVLLQRQVHACQDEDGLFQAGAVGKRRRGSQVEKRPDLHGGPDGGG